MSEHIIHVQNDGAAQVTVQRSGAVAVLMMHARPDNALTPALCQELSAQVQAALGDSAVQGVVIASGARVFSLGHNARTRMDGAADRAIDDLCNLIARAQKPVVAALAGQCAGAGFSLALACRARVGADRTTAAIDDLPEFCLGFDDAAYAVLPSGGGAVRLAQLLPARAALNMLIGGQMAGFADARALGLLDGLARQEQCMSQACDLALTLASGAAQLHRRTPFAAAREDLAEIARIRDDWQDKSRRNIGLAYVQGDVAQAMITAVESVYILPAAAAQLMGEAAAARLCAAPTARALAYAGFALAKDGIIKGAQTPPDLAALTLELRRKMGQVVSHFEGLGLARGDILGGFASYGIAVPTGSAAPPCPAGASDVMPALLAVWANLGAQMLREGAILRGAQLDGAVLAANMFPRTKGGPMYQADLRGPLVMRAELARRSAQTGGEMFAPDPMWDDLISRGRGLI